MIEWTDDNTNLLDVLTAHYLGEELNPECCSKSDIHFYMHKFDTCSPRGSAWVWCSNCKKYVHADGFTANTKNCDGINVSLLCAVPDYLESIKSRIDEHNRLNRP